MLYKIILAFAAHYNLVIHQMNVKSAFLNTKLDKEIYMKLSDKFKNSEKDMIFRLPKFLYRLMQAL